MDLTEKYSDHILISSGVMCLGALSLLVTLPASALVAPWALPTLFGAYSFSTSILTTSPSINEKGEEIYKTSFNKVVSLFLLTVTVFTTVALAASSLHIFFVGVLITVIVPLLLNLFKVNKKSNKINKKDREFNTAKEKFMNLLGKCRDDQAAIRSSISEFHNKNCEIRQEIQILINKNPELFKPTDQSAYFSRNRTSSDDHTKGLSIALDELQTSIPNLPDSPTIGDINSAYTELEEYHQNTRATYSAIFENFKKNNEELKKLMTDLERKTHATI